MHNVNLSNGQHLVSFSFREFMQLQIGELRNNIEDVKSLLEPIFGVDNVDSIINLAFFKYSNKQLCSIISETFCLSDGALSMFGDEYITFTLDDIKSVNSNTTKYNMIKDILTYDLCDNVSKYIDVESFFNKEWVGEMKQGKEAINTYAQLVWACKEDESSFFVLKLNK